MIEKIKRVPLRNVWKHEAHNFTTWLENNIDVVSDVIDIELNNAEREISAGKFNVDLVAESSGGDIVIIENQLEKSNHDHLGKVITYLTVLEAKIAIWIVSDPRPEHIRAISWLNESSSASFYLLKIEAIQIGESNPAPLLTLIVGPTEEAREIGEKKKEISERNVLRKHFWTGLLAVSKSKTKMHSNISPSPYNWIGTSVGINGLSLVYVVRKHESGLELYIDKGKDSEEENTNIFNELHDNMSKIEEVFENSLEWEELETKRACRISFKVKGGYRDKEEAWVETHNELVDLMIAFNNALKPFLKKLKL